MLHWLAAYELGFGFHAFRASHVSLAVHIELDVMCFTLLDSSTFLTLIRYVQIIINIFVLIASFEIIIVISFMKKSVKQVHENSEVYVDLSVLMVELTIFDIILSLLGIYGLYKDSFSLTLIYGTILALQYFLFIAFSMNLIQLIVTALRALLAVCFLCKHRNRSEINVSEV